MSRREADYELLGPPIAELPSLPERRTSFLTKVIAIHLPPEESYEANYSHLFGDCPRFQHLLYRAIRSPIDARTRPTIVE